MARKNQAKAAEKPTAPEVIEVEFLKSPTGAYGLAYHKGQTASLSAELAGKLIAEKYAVAVEQEADQEAEQE